jgi:hypothetical protein
MISGETLDSTQDKARNVVGRWIGSNKKYLFTIVFDHQLANMPTNVAFHMYEASEQKVGDVYGGSRTEWQRYGKSGSLVPKKTSIFTTMPDGRENETDLYWTWLEPKKWETVNIDFESLAETHAWHAPFDELFESDPKDQ